MDHFWTILFALTALLWAISGARAARGMAGLPRLDEAPQPDGEYPSVSILVAARDEARQLPTALASLLAQDYPNYEIIAVNDRSRDATPQILDELSRTDDKLQVIHLSDLPPGWLGKPHALTRAYQNSNGRWLLFTDADVHFAPDLLRRSVGLVLANGWDHLTLVPFVELKGFWEKTAVSYWVGSFIQTFKPWQIARPGSKDYVGVGAFQLLRRSAYEELGTHQRLALEVVEDVKLGKLVKLGGFGSGCALAGERLRIRWVEGLGSYLRNLTKNMFAACRFSVSYVLFVVVLSLSVTLLPIAGVVLASGSARYLAGISVLAAVLAHMSNGVRLSRVSSLYALTYPLGALLLVAVLLRSTVFTLWRGGVVWRDTFYPLEDLRKGMI